MTDDESRAIFMRWVAEYYEMPLVDVAALPWSVYAAMSETVLEDMEGRVGKAREEERR